MPSTQAKYTKPFWIVLYALSVLAYMPHAASAEQNDTSTQTRTQLPPHLDCGKPKGSTTKGICLEIANKYQECLAYNERLGNDFDCGKDKHLVELRAIADSAEEDYLQSSKPGPRIGMSKKQVIERTSWGRPGKVNSTIRSGRVSEQWIYGSGNYLYFENGRLKAIQTSE